MTCSRWPSPPILQNLIFSTHSRYFRADAAFANPEVYEFQEAEHYKYAIRLPANQILQQRIGYLLKRPVGRPPIEVRRYYANFSYQAQSWKIPVSYTHLRAHETR